jgi:hypothetical protein
VLTAHPDLAGKLAAARRLTPESTAEQASAGLDALTDEEREAFDRTERRYTGRFGFPFIIAVRDHDKPPSSILAAFRGLPQVERIADCATTSCRDDCPATADAEAFAPFALRTGSGSLIRGCVVAITTGPGWSSTGVAPGSACFAPNCAPCP